MAGLVGRLGVRFTAIVGSGPKNDVVVLRFAANDGKHYEIEIAAGAVGLTISAMQRALATADSSVVQPIVVTGVGGARWQDGSPLIEMMLEGGGSMMLRLERGDLRQLRSLLDQIAAPPDEPKH